MRKRALFATVAVMLALAVSAHAEDKKDAAQADKPAGPPPALVVLEEIRSGRAESMTEYVGTAYYARQATVAAEVSGKVLKVYVNDGQRIDKSSPIVELDSEIAEANLASTRASFEQSLIELERAEKDLARMKKLYDEGTIAESLYDEYFYKAAGLHKKVDGLRADRDRLELELSKKTVLAPFSGVVVSKDVEIGEWVASGGKVATLASTSDIDVLVSVPESVLGFMDQGRKVDLTIGQKKLSGKVIAIFPSGDVATRTFTVKVRADNAKGIYEGMGVRVSLPNGPVFDGLLVNRDAVINKFGSDVVFVDNNGAAKMIQVRVLGYSGLKAAISGEGLSAGMRTVVKGNERIMDGQTIAEAGGR